MPPRIPKHSSSPFSTTSLLSALPPTSPAPIRTTTIAKALRQFSTTNPLPGRSSKKQLSKILSKAPPYPYPIKHTFKQSWFGLYANKHVQFGNNIPEQEFTITRRRWYPNIKQKKLWSFGLGKWVECKLATNVLRTIDKVGGLDNYLLSEKPARLKELGPWGWELRHRLQGTKAVQRKYQAERVQMGLISVSKQLEMNKTLSINRGVQLQKSTYKKVVTPGEKSRVMGFRERWRRAATTPKVLFGEPWKGRSYRKAETAREQQVRKTLEEKRLRTREARLAKKKLEHRQKKLEVASAKKKEESFKMERLSKMVAAKRGDSQAPKNALGV